MSTNEILTNNNLSDSEKWELLNEKAYTYNNNKSYRYNNQNKELACYYCRISNLTQVETAEVVEIIENIQPLKDLCKNCKIEEILTVIVLRTKRLRRPKQTVHIDKYKIWKDNCLNWKKYSTISDRIGAYFQSKILIGYKKGY